MTTETKPHIPPHLKAFGWYASHQAWLKLKGLYCRHDPGEAPASYADLTDANLTRAYLTRAYLTGANLAGADLTGANLTRANLTRANLTRADLTGADLTDANLTRAYLTRAYLTGAKLAGADLTGADLTGANLTGADLTGADLTGANLTRANLTRADLAGGIPVIANIDAAILAAISAPGHSLNMSDWHACDTTHCRAGWVTTLAGPAGKLLEGIYGTGPAAALIYAASGSHPVPNFYATNEEAMADIKQRAAR